DAGPDGSCSRLGEELQRGLFTPGVAKLLGNRGEAVERGDRDTVERGGRERRKRVGGGGHVPDKVWRRRAEAAFRDNAAMGQPVPRPDGADDPPAPDPR